MSRSPARAQPVAQMDLLFPRRTACSLSGFGSDRRSPPRQDEDSWEDATAHWLKYAARTFSLRIHSGAPAGAAACHRLQPVGWVREQHQVGFSRLLDRGLQPSLIEPAHKVDHDADLRNRLLFCSMDCA